MAKKLIRKKQAKKRNKQKAKHYATQNSYRALTKKLRNSTAVFKRMLHMDVYTKKMSCLKLGKAVRSRCRNVAGMKKKMMAAWASASNAHTLTTRRPKPQLACPYW